jgi:hypothetical protein
LGEWRRLFLFRAKAMTPDQAHELAGKITTAVLDQIEKDRYHPMSDNIKMVIATQLMAGSPKAPGLPLDSYTQDDVIALAAEAMGLVYEVANNVHPVNISISVNNALTNTRAALKRFGIQV